MIKFHKYIKYFLLFCVLFGLGSCSTAEKKTPDFNAADSLKEANNLIKERYYDQATVILEEIKSKDGSQKYASIATIRLADTNFDQELYDEAAVEYQSFLDVHPFHKYASYAQYRLAMTFFKRIKTVDISYSFANEAIKEFKKLQRTYPRNPYMAVTENRIKMCWSILAEYEFYVGQFYYKKGAYEAAIGRFNGILNKFPDSKKESEALYLLGISYENTGQRDKAIISLTALIDKYPTIELSSEAKEFLNALETTQ